MKSLRESVSPNLCFPISQYFLSISMLNEFLPCFLQAIAVEKLPPKGSKTKSPLLLDALIKISNSLTGI